MQSSSRPPSESKGARGVNPWLVLAWLAFCQEMVQMALAQHHTALLHHGMGVEAKALVRCELVAQVDSSIRAIQRQDAEASDRGREVAVHPHTLRGRVNRDQRPGGPPAGGRCEAGAPSNQYGHSRAEGHCSDWALWLWQVDLAAEHESHERPDRWRAP